MLTYMRSHAVLVALLAACDKHTATTTTTEAGPGTSSAGAAPTSSLQASLASRPLSFKTALLAKRGGEAAYLFLSTQERGCDSFPSPTLLQSAEDEKVVLLTLAPLLLDVVDYGPRAPTAETWRVTAARWTGGNDAPAAGTADVPKDIETRGGSIRLSYQVVSQLRPSETLTLEGSVAPTACADERPRLPPPLLVAKIGTREAPLRGATLETQADGWQTLVLASLPRTCEKAAPDQANDLILRIRTKGETQQMNASGARVAGNLSWPTHFSITTGGSRVTIDGEEQKGSLSLHGRFDVLRCPK